MEKVIGVRFRSGTKLYYFSPNGIDVKKGDDVIVETVRGLECGSCVMGITEMDDDSIVHPLKPIIRVATEGDKKQAQQLIGKEKEAMSVFEQKIAQHNLEMLPVHVEYTFDSSKIIFYFTADGRVDFRELVKDLAGVFHTRIELCQIGVRDETKMMGGLGPCGRVCCCHAHMNEFQPVSIKMAKDQGLSLNPVNISGLCGRLMCCLKYEQNCYEDAKKRLPKMGAEVVTPDGYNGVVCAIMPLPEKVQVKFELPDGTFDMRTYHIDELEIGGVKPNPPKEKEEKKHAEKTAEHKKEQEKPKAEKETAESDEGEKQKKPRDRRRRHRRHRPAKDTAAKEE